MAWDRAHAVPHDFLRQIVAVSQTFGSSVAMGPGAGDAKVTEMDAETRKKRQIALTTIISAEELSWGDAGRCLCVPGPRLVDSKVPARKQRRSRRSASSRSHRRHVDGPEVERLRADRAGRRQRRGGHSHELRRKDGKHWVINGRKCFITNGASRTGRGTSSSRRSIRRSVAKATRPSGWSRRARPGPASARSRTRSALAASETAEPRLRGLPRAGGEPPRRRGELHDEAGLHDRDEDLRQHAPSVAAMAIGIGRAAATTTPSNS